MMLAMSPDTRSRGTSTEGTPPTATPGVPWYCSTGMMGSSGCALSKSNQVAYSVTFWYTGGWAMAAAQACLNSGASAGPRKTYEMYTVAIPHGWLTLWLGVKKVKPLKLCGERGWGGTRGSVDWLLAEKLYKIL